MKLPYGYVLVGKEIVINEEREYLSIILLEPAWEKLLICSL